MASLRQLSPLVAKMPQDQSDPDKPRTVFAQRFFKALGDLAGKNQKEVADEAGIKPTTLSGWLSGPSEPTASDLRSLSNVLKCTVDFLVGKTESPTVLPPSHYIVDLERQEKVRAKIDVPEGRWFWPVPDKHEILSSAQMEEREGEVLRGKRVTAKKGRVEKKEGDLGH